MGKRKVTSIKIDPQLWTEFRKYALDEGKSVSELLESLIKKEIEKGKK